MASCTADHLVAVGSRSDSDGVLLMFTFSDLLKEVRNSGISNDELGKKFEKLVAYYFRNEAIYQNRFSEVWLWMEWPERNGPDTGIDLVARERNTNEYCAIQCKCFDPERTLNKGDIDSFFTASGRRPFTSRIIVCTTKKLTTHVKNALDNQQIPVTLLGLQDLDNSSIHWGIHSTYYKFKEIFEAANNGDANAQCEIGKIYEEGFGVPINYEEAMKWYRKAANQGHIDAMYNIGLMYKKCRGTPENYSAESFIWFYKAAEEGHAIAQYEVGIKYKKDKNYEEAFKWIENSAEQDYGDAQYELGKMYEFGRGACEDFFEAFRQYRKSAGRENTNAMFRLGILYTEAPTWHRKYKSRFSGWKNADAMVKENFLYENREGIKINNTERLKWITLSATKGNVKGQYHLGREYENGEIYVRAFGFYNMAAKQGCATAQYRIGLMYSDGLGVPQSDQIAFKWYFQAAEQGDSDAQCMLGWVYKEGLGVDKSYEEAVRWYCRAAEQDDSDAQFRLGLMYEEGLGVNESCREAVKWYRKAAEQDNSDAKGKIFEILRDKLGYITALKYRVFGIFPELEIWKAGD